MFCQLRRKGALQKLLNLSHVSWDFSPVGPFPDGLGLIAHQKFLSAIWSEKSIQFHSVDIC